MPTVIACPSCGGKLRVADELRGQLARCPACNHTFDTALAAGPPPAPEAEPSAPGRDLPLQLSVDDSAEAPAPPPRPTTRGLVGAVELPVDESAPSPPAVPTPPPAPPEPRRPPRLADAERREWDGDRPSLRRDCAPDRGAAVLTMGILSLMMLLFCGPVGMILGLIGWVMGQGDLRKMKDGRMDPEGRGMTYAGWLCGLIGTGLNLLWTLCCVGCFGLGFYSGFTSTTQKAYPAPPVKKGPANPGGWKDAPPGVR